MNNAALRIGDTRSSSNRMEASTPSRQEAANDAAIDLRIVLAVELGQREHHRHAGDEDQQREYEIPEAKTVPLGMGKLRGNKRADAPQHRPHVTRHFMECPRGAFAAEQPEHAEAS